jgi:hypothetical protein
VNKNLKQDGWASLLGAHGRYIHEPGELLVRILGALNLENDGQHDSVVRVPKLEHQIRAELHREQLIESGLDHGDRRTGREVEVEENREKWGASAGLSRNMSTRGRRYRDPGAKDPSCSMSALPAILHRIRRG